jgi:YgiT-type zinc finger domain-containing protein
MKRVICKHVKTHAGEVTITLERDGAALVFRNVPAQVCENCGEAYVNEATTNALLAAAEAATEADVQVEVRLFVAVA